LQHIGKTQKAITQPILAKELQSQHIAEKKMLKARKHNNVYENSRVSGE